MLYEDFTKILRESSSINHNNGIKIKSEYREILQQSVLNLDNNLFNFIFTLHLYHKSSCSLK